MMLGLIRDWPFKSFAVILKKFLRPLRCFASRRVNDSPNTSLANPNCLSTMERCK